MLNEWIFAFKAYGTSNMPYLFIVNPVWKGFPDTCNSRIENKVCSQCIISVILISSSFHKNRILLHHCCLDAPSLSYFSLYTLCTEVKISKSLWASQGKNLSHSLWYPLGCIQQILGFGKCLLNWTNSPSLSLSLLCTFPITLVLSSGCQLLFTSLHSGFLWVKTLKKSVNLHIFGIAFLNKMG